MSYTSYVLANPDLIAHYNAKIKSSGKSMEDWGKAIGRNMEVKMKIENILLRILLIHPLQQKL